MKKTLRKEILASVFATCIFANVGIVEASSYNPSDYNDLKGIVNPVVTYDGAYRPGTDSAIYGKNVLGIDEDTACKDAGNGVRAYSYNGGTIYGVKTNGGVVLNLNINSSDTVDGVTLPAAKPPNRWSAEWDQLRQLYNMDHAATMAGLEAEKRIDADNLLHKDDVASVGHTFTDGKLTTTITTNSGETLTADAVDLKAWGDAEYGSKIDQNSVAIQNNTTAIEEIKNNNVTNITQEGDNKWVVNQTINGEQSKIEITDTNTTNTEMTSGWSGNNVDISVKDSDGNAVSTTIKDVAKASDLKAETGRAIERENTIERESIERDIAMDNRIDGLSDRITDIENEAREGIAIAMAMSGITPLQHDPADPEKENRFQGGIALSTWKGKQAIAAGAFYTPHRDAIYTFKIGTTTDGSSFGGVFGATFRFKQRKS